MICIAENPAHDDPDGGGEDEDTGGADGEPGHPAGIRRAVPPHALLHLRTPAPSRTLGLQTRLRRYRNGVSEFYLILSSQKRAR